MKMEAPPGKRKQSTKPKQRWAGAIEGIHRGTVYGWAIDRHFPHNRVVLEICLNHEPIGTVTADVARTDLNQHFSGDVCHGFIAELGYHKSSKGTITVRVANTDHVLPGSIEWNDGRRPPVSATSFAFGDGGLRVHGWCFDARSDARELTVAAYLGDRMLVQTIANEFHPALHGKGIGKHGFILDLPFELADGRLHAVRVVDGDGTPLNGSPITVCLAAAGLRSLLPEQVAPLLDAAIGSYEAHVPRSVGISHYHAWSRLFEGSGTTQAPSEIRVGLIVTGNANPAPTLESLASQSHRLLEVFSGSSFRQQVSAAMAAGCEVIASVRAGDTLPPHALTAALQGFSLPGAELVYTDSEYRGRPWLKPAWNPDYAFGSDYLLELMLVRTSAINKQDLPHDAAALAWEAIALCAKRNPLSIVHVPHVLYQFASMPDQGERQCRAAACSVALALLEPGAVLETLPGTPVDSLFDKRRVRRPLSKKERALKVSIIIPTRDGVELLKRCIESLDAFTDWPQLEIIVIDNGSAQAATKTYFRKLAKRGVRILPMPGPFNFADLNNLAVEQAEGDIIVLMNNDIEALHGGWLDEMVAELMRPNVGMVGAKLLWQNGMVQHGGVLMGLGNAAGHYGNHLADGDFGDHGRNQLTQQLSGVTAACLAIRRAHFIALGGMNGLDFPVAFNDVDFCLRLRTLGKLITWTPFARLLHAESASRGKEDTPEKAARALREISALRARWGHLLTSDPAYHPALSLDPHSPAMTGLALPPRDRRPRTCKLDAP